MVKNFGRIILWVSLICILSSFFAEFVLGYAPCRQCLWQRAVYFILIVLGSCLLRRSTRRRWLPFIGMVALFGIWLSLMHLLTVFGWIEGACAVQKIASIDAFALSLKEKCQTNVWKIFGLPAPLYNLIIFSIILLYSSFLYKNIAYLDGENSYWSQEKHPDCVQKKFSGSILSCLKRAGTVCKGRPFNGIVLMSLISFFGTPLALFSDQQCEVDGGCFFFF